MEKDYIRKLRQPGQTVNPLFNFLGVKIEQISQEKAVLLLALREEFIQGAGVVAGGILATLADEAMAHVVVPNLEEGEDTATIEMNMRYLKPIKSGAIRAEATVVKKGRKVITVAADVREDNGQLLAQAGASFMVIERKP